MRACARGISSSGSARGRPPVRPRARAARARERTGGRPCALEDDDLPQIQALMRDSGVSTRQICERLDISKATLYRYVGPDGERRR